jgi:hypothetical protein
MVIDKIAQAMNGVRIRDGFQPNPSSSVAKKRALSCNDLCILKPSFLHYILHDFGRAGQIQAQTHQ